MYSHFGKCVCTQYNPNVQYLFLLSQHFPYALSSAKTCADQQFSKKLNSEVSMSNINPLVFISTRNRIYTLTFWAIASKYKSLSLTDMHAFCRHTNAHILHHAQKRITHTIVIGYIGCINISINCYKKSRPKNLHRYDALAQNYFALSTSFSNMRSVKAENQRKIIIQYKIRQWTNGTIKNDHMS